MEGNRMKLSVIIPCLNAADSIATQLEALANQRWSEPWEVIVSDNGSTDGSMDIVKKYEGRLPHLCIVDASGRRGRAYARNMAAKVARGESLAFCDADDEVAPGWLAAMGEALSKYDFVACRIDVYKLNPLWIAKTRNHSQASGLQTKGAPPNLSHAGGSTIGVKRRFHDEVGGFDEAFIRQQDTDYCWRIQLKGAALHFVPEAVVHVRLRDTIKDTYLQSFGTGEYAVLLYKKYLPLGMLKLTLKQGIVAWKNLVVGFIRSVPKIRNKGDLIPWASRFGVRLGRLKGSVKYRVLAL
jgi:glycosyltransferase involved in cell wall biosynthesis